MHGRAKFVGKRFVAPRLAHPFCAAGQIVAAVGMGFLPMFFFDEDEDGRPDEKNSVVGHQVLFSHRPFPPLTPFAETPERTRRLTALLTVCAPPRLQMMGVLLAFLTVFRSQTSYGMYIEVRARRDAILFHVPSLFLMRSCAALAFCLLPQPLCCR